MPEIDRGLGRGVDGTAWPPGVGLTGSRRQPGRAMMALGLPRPSAAASCQDTGCPVDRHPARHSPRPARRDADRRPRARAARAAPLAGDRPAAARGRARRGARGTDGPGAPDADRTRRAESRAGSRSRRPAPDPDADPEPTPVARARRRTAQRRASDPRRPRRRPPRPSRPRLRTPRPTATPTPTTSPRPDSLRLRRLPVIRGNITPKSVVATQTGLFFAQNMMYRHTMTVYNRKGELVKTHLGPGEPLELRLPRWHDEPVNGAPVEAAVAPDGKHIYVTQYSMYGPGFDHPGWDTGWVDDTIDRSFVYEIRPRDAAQDARLPGRPGAQGRGREPGRQVAAGRQLDPPRRLARQPPDRARRSSGSSSAATRAGSRSSPTRRKVYLSAESPAKA